MVLFSFIKPFHSKIINIHTHIHCITFLLLGESKMFLKNDIFVFIKHVTVRERLRQKIAPVQSVGYESKRKSPAIESGTDVLWTGDDEESEHLPRLGAKSREVNEREVVGAVSQRRGQRRERFDQGLQKHSFILFLFSSLRITDSTLVNPQRTSSDL